MTSVPRQLAIFAGVLAVLYTGGYAAGHIIGDDGGGGHGQGSQEEMTDEVMAAMARLMRRG